MSSTYAGITEGGDPALDESWVDWANRGNVTVLVTKDVGKILDRYAPGIYKKKVVFHATCTGYGGTPFEPGVPAMERTLEALSEVPPEERKKFTVRIDPIIPTPECVARSMKVREEALALGFDKFRVSVMDYYPHVRERIGREMPIFRDFLDKAYYGSMGKCDWMGDHTIHLDRTSRAAILDLFPGAEICGEPGFECEGCVSAHAYNVLGVPCPTIGLQIQRRLGCECIAAKKELLGGKTRCAHRCIYCYWRDA